MGKAKRAALEPTAAAANDDALLALLAAGLRLQSNDAIFKVSGNTLLLNGANTFGAGKTFTISGSVVLLRSGA